MSLTRPAPPPKPRGYFPAVFNKMATEMAPQDSDTDSGICADSDQSSPRQPSQPLFPGSYQSAAQLYRHVTDDSRDYLTPNSARRLFASSEQSPRRTLPPRPIPAKGSPIHSRNGKPQFRVRFADEVDSGASTSSGSSESNTSPRTATEASNRTELKNRTPPHSSYTKPLTVINNNYSKIYDPSAGQRSYDSLPRIQNRRRNSYSIEDVESLPEPPTYAVAVQRMRNIEPVLRESVRDSVIRQDVERTLRNRSASLPRGTRTADLGNIYGETPIFDNYSRYQAMPEQLVGSLDNLNLGSEYSSDSMRRRLPVTPLIGSTTKIPDSIDADREGNRMPSYLRQRRCRGRIPPLSRRSASVGRYPDSMDYDYRPPEPAVRAQLIALDQRGFRTVLVEKTQPGPFGFYIATGVMNGQRGIFISRVSLPSLSPMLSVGDEILYVDDELVKGRTLEYVQSLIAGKTAVAIVLLPTVGTAMC